MWGGQYNVSIMWSLRRVVVHPRFGSGCLLCEDSMDKNKKKEISCKDCLCGKEDCKHENLKYCECCGGVHCVDCDEKWESPPVGPSYIYNVKDRECPCSEDSYMCVCDRERD